MNIEGRTLSTHQPASVPPLTDTTHSHPKDSTPRDVEQEGKLVLLSTSSSTELTQVSATLGGTGVRMEHCIGGVGLFTPLHVQCMYIRAYVSMYVQCMYECTYVSMYVHCMYVRTYICVYVCTYVHTYD